MSVTGTILRSWDSESYNTENFILTTKFTDLGSPDTFKKVYGFYCNISFDPLVKPDGPIYYNFTLCYRKYPKDEWRYLGDIAGGGNAENGVFNLGEALNTTKKLESGNYFNVKNIQLQLKGTAVSGGFGVNDFGIIYRSIRETSTEEHDES
tara:strand:- start:23579 stop:24031 length:453 start_codon:yes stop_codon:yes gene_type:complete